MERGRRKLGGDADIYFLHCDDDFTGVHICQNLQIVYFKYEPYPEQV